MQLLDATALDDYISFIFEGHGQDYHWQHMVLNIVDDITYDAAFFIQKIIDIFDEEEGAVWQSANEVIEVFVGYKDQSMAYELADRIDEYFFKYNVPAYLCHYTVQNLDREIVQRLAVKPSVDSKALKTILIADDNVEMRDLVIGTVKDFANCIEKIDGSQVVSAYQEYKPDAVFLDLNIPVKPAHIILADIRQLDKTALIFLNVPAENSDAVTDDVKEHVDGFFCKPYTSEKILELLNSNAYFSGLKDL